MVHKFRNSEAKLHNAICKLVLSLLHKVIRKSSMNKKQIPTADPNLLDPGVDKTDIGEQLIQIMWPQSG